VNGPDELKIKLRRRKVGSAAVLTVEGELHYNEAVKLKEELARILDSGTVNLVIDVEKVNYLSSSAIGSLVSANGRIRKNGGVLYLAGMTPELMELFQLLRLTAILQFSASTDEALAKLRGEE